MPDKMEDYFGNSNKWRSRGVIEEKRGFMGDNFGWRSGGVMMAERNCFWGEMTEVKIGGKTGVIYILVQPRAVGGFLSRDCLSIGQKSQTATPNRRQIDLSNPHCSSFRND